MPSRRAIRKLIAWLAFCRHAGWSKELMPKLADLWWAFHDEETGELAATRED